MKNIYVVGYPKSGNTWLSRLLGSCLDSPVTGIKTAKPLATEGFDRSGEYFVRQLHLKPVTDSMPPFPSAVDNAWWYDWRIRPQNNAHFVHIVRDVRDVIVSAHHYWQRETIEESVSMVLDGTHPIKMHGSWQKYVSDWETCPVWIPRIRFVDLKIDPFGTLDYVFNVWNSVGGFVIPDKTTIGRAIDAQSFENTRARIEQDGDDRPYGKVVQLRNLRRGTVGDWRNHLTNEHCQLVEIKAGSVLRQLGYLDNDLDRFWWHTAGTDK
jgi:hypothetical protein